MTTSYDVAAAFLVAIGAPVTPGMVRAVAIWLAFEIGDDVVGFNLFNLHEGPACPAPVRFCRGYGDLPGQIGNRFARADTDENVAVFGTLEAGVAANAANLLRECCGYPKVIARARADDPAGFLQALQDSSWSAGHYATPDGQGKLVKAWKGSGDYDRELTMDPGTAPGTEELTRMEIHDEVLRRVPIGLDAKIYDQDGRFKRDNGRAWSRLSLWTTKIGGALYYAVRLPLGGVQEELLVADADPKVGPVQVLEINGARETAIREAAEAMAAAKAIPKL